VMVYTLQKFRHYLFGVHFKMYTDHAALKYLVKKPFFDLMKSLDHPTL